MNNRGAMFGLAVVLSGLLTYAASPAAAQNAPRDTRPANTRQTRVPANAAPANGPQNQQQRQQQIQQQQIQQQQARQQQPQQAQRQAPLQQNQQPLQQQQQRQVAQQQALSQEPQAVDPAWWPLTEQHAKYVDDILGYWEFSCSKIDRYECKFVRWIYDPAAVPADPKTGDIQAREISQGVIKYMKPDKALYKTERVDGYVRPMAPDQQARYEELPVERFGDHWVCDGKSIFEFDYGQKILRQIELPPEAQGEAISKGPLPFLFGAKRAEILERFRIRVITPKDVQGEYWLEAWPRTREDASQFKFVHIIIDESDYLPKALILFSRTFNERNPARESFTFEDRKTNFPLQNLNILKLWQRDFFQPAIPDGWKKVVERLVPADEIPGPAPVARQPEPAAARMPAPNATRDAAPGGATGVARTPAGAPVNAGPVARNPAPRGTAPRR